jgi:hypothetical protein
MPRRLIDSDSSIECWEPGEHLSEVRGSRCAPSRRVRNAPRSSPSGNLIRPQRDRLDAHQGAPAQMQSTVFRSRA